MIRSSFNLIQYRTRKSGLNEHGPRIEAYQATDLVLGQSERLRWGIRFAQALAILLIGALLSQPAAAQSRYYSITDVGPMPPYHAQTFVNGINASGQVAGYGSKTPFPGAGAFLWTPGATDGIPENPQMKDLGNFNGGDYWFSAQAWGLNNKGQVVGEADFQWYSWNIPHAFVWENGMMTDLGTLGDGLYSVARNINDLGMVVGWSDTESTKLNANRHAFIYDTATKRMTDLGIDHSYGQSINDRNQVVGTYFPEPGIERGFLWDPATGFHDLHNLVSCGGEKSEAAAINNKMQVVGWCKDEDDVAHAFFLDLNTGEVKHLGGSQATMATALNNHGHVVGTFKYTELSDHAFEWDPKTRVMNDLNDRIPYNSGWTLFYAWGVNDAGQIAGSGAHQTEFSENRGFVMSPDANPSLVTLKASPATVTRGGIIEVRWTAPSGHPPRDWIVFREVGAPDGFYLDWEYTGNETSGTMVFRAPSDPGSYEFRYLADNTFRIVTTSNPVKVD